MSTALSVKTLGIKLIYCLKFFSSKHNNYSNISIDTKSKKANTILITMKRLGLKMGLV